MKKQEREYKTTLLEESLPMDKYTELLKDIATLIADTSRENFLLKHELNRTQEQLAAAEHKIADALALARVDGGEDRADA